MNTSFLPALARKVFQSSTLGVLVLWGCLFLFVLSWFHIGGNRADFHVRRSEYMCLLLTLMSTFLQGFNLGDCVLERSAVPPALVITSLKRVVP